MIPNENKYGTLELSGIIPLIYITTKQFAIKLFKNYLPFQEGGILK